MFGFIYLSVYSDPVSLFEINILVCFGFSFHIGFFGIWRAFGFACSVCCCVSCVSCGVHFVRRVRAVGRHGCRLSIDTILIIRAFAVRASGHACGVALCAAAERLYIRYTVKLEMKPNGANACVGVSGDVDER